MSMLQQVIVKPAEGHQRPRTLRVTLGGRSFDLDLTHKPNRDLAVWLGYSPSRPTCRDR